MMKEREVMSERGVLVAVALVSVIAWVQLFRVIYTTPPTTMMQFLAFALWFVAMGGVGTLGSWVGLRRIERQEVHIALRHGGWFGLLWVLYAWIELLGSLSWLMAFVVLGIIVSAESLCMLRDLGI